MLKFVLLIICCIAVSGQSGDYNHNSNSNTINQTWMTGLGDGIPLRKLSLIGTQGSMNQMWWDVLYNSQTLPLQSQMRAGMRIFDLQCRHYYDALPLYNGIVDQGMDLQDVILTMKIWLATYSGQVLVARISEEWIPDGNTMTFEATVAAYMANNTDIIWVPTTQNPTLGQVRGKIVLLQAFSANGVYGLLEQSFTVQPDYYMWTNWNLYDKWINVKAALNSASSGGGSYISFWTGYGGSYRFFVASGQVFNGNGGSLLWTGLSSIFHGSSYPDFPRSYFWPIYYTDFQGINILGSSYIANNNLTAIGWVFTNFAGDQLITRAIATNYRRYGPCTAADIAVGCTSCDAAQQCLTCNTSLGYIYDSVNKICIAAPGYYLATPYPLLCNSSIFGCAACSSNMVCTSCNATSNYALDPTTNSCIAAVGYYLDANNISVPCNITLRGCTSCTSNITCTGCNTVLSYILQAASCVCDATAHMIDAVTQSVCICQPGYYQYASTCILMLDCSLPASGCTSCISPMCSYCNETAFFTLDAALQICICMSGYYYDGTACQPCNITLTGCTSCATSDICLACTSTFLLSLPSCVCSAGTFLDATMPGCTNCQIGCLICTNAITCVTCDISNNFILLLNTSCDCNAGYYLDTTTNICDSCTSMAGCLTCNVIGCVSCDPTLNFTLDTTNFVCDCAFGYYIGSNQMCQFCTMTGCLDCTSATVCTQCDVTTFFLNATTQLCDEICGDGFRFILQCDDGNNINGDGCSSDCNVEPNYACVGGDSTIRSVCSYTQPIVITLTKSIKQSLTNSILLTFTLQPPLSDLSSVNFSQVISTNLTGVQSMTFTYDNKGTLVTQIDYNSSIELQPVSITFTPPYTAAFYSTPPTTIDFSINSQDNQGVYYFSPEIYLLQTQLDIVMTVLGYAYLGLTLIALPFGRVIPIEMASVAQLAFLGISVIENLQPLMIPFKKLYPVNGINTLLSNPVQSASLPSRIAAIGLTNQYIYNINYSLVLIILPLLVASILYIVHIFVNDKQKWLERAKWSCGEWFWAGLLLLEYYTTASLLIQFLYTDNKDGVFYVGATLGCMILLLGIVMTLLYAFSKGKLGEFRSYFKLSPFGQKYELYFASNRLVLISLMISLNSVQVLSYIMVWFPLASIILLAVFKPFTENYNTYRAIFNECCVLLILASYSYYRIEIANLNIVNSFSLYIPVGIAGLLLICLFVNIFFLIKTFRQRMFDKTNMNSRKVSSSSHQSIEIEMMRQLRVKLNDNCVQSRIIGTTKSSQIFKHPNMTPSNLRQLIHNSMEIDSSRIIIDKTKEESQNTNKKDFVIEHKQPNRIQATKLTEQEQKVANELFDMI